MAWILPFRGILYNVSKVSVEDVLAPPYDIITPEYREELYKRSSYNIVRIDFGKEVPGDTEAENKYTRARRHLDTWIEEGVLLRSERPSFYAYEMSYRINGEQKQLRGFLCLVKIEELGKGGIYPHECTYSKPKQDRLNLLKSCEANISPIFSLYKSSEKIVSSILSDISSGESYISAEDKDGAIHKIWPVDETEKIEIIKNELEDKAIFIADGHHRYETTFEFYREIHQKLKNPSGTQPFDYVMMFLVNMMDEGITILPTHRLIKEIPENISKTFPEYFDIEPVKSDFNIEKRLSGKKRVFGFFRNRDEEWYLLKYKGGNLSEIHSELRDIDVFILHELIFKKIFKTTDIGYEMDVKTALNRVKSGEFSAAFFLNPTKIGDVEKAALSSLRMPPKSTYFYPKLLTGLVIYKW
ncbi:MAG: DUF1015 domain-containing protein [Nitrospirae bacterium]|jgi:uncharacterized protein (DUF1015 family)|nr:DUF1015 domain-containing protein [Nitrospirota bacterium]